MKKIAFVVALIICMSQSLFTQASSKIGYINSDELLSSMPEVKKADSVLENLYKSYSTQLEKMTKELETKYKEYQQTAASLSDAVREVKEKEMTDLQGRIESTRQTAEKKVSDKRDELYKPILEKADKAIKDVAKEKAYDYILDVAKGSVLFANETDNIIGFVKTKLGIK